MNDITYPVILTHEDNVFYIGVPDLEIDNYATYGETIEEALQAAKEVMVLHLYTLEEENRFFPKRSEINSLKNSLNENQEIIHVNFSYTYEKSLMKIQYKKKTLSIPVWLDLLATNKNINFSQILQSALKKELGIQK